MTLDQFVDVQAQLIGVFGWFVRWWLIAFLVAGVFAAVGAWALIVAREMISKF